MKSVEQRLDELERPADQRRVLLETHVGGKIKHQWLTASNLRHLSTADAERLLSQDKIVINVRYGGQDQGEQ